ncbi:SbcD-like subunit of palindrome specific endonucl ease [Vibrio phage K120 g1]
MLNLFTDPHIGLGARTNTSATSTKALDHSLYAKAANIVNKYNNLICAGDLFHRSHNREGVIAQGVNIANGCDLMLGGNHDNTNRTDDCSSLDIVSQVCESVMTTPVGRVLGHPNLEFDSGEKVTMIPHHSSQELFDQAIVRACDYSGDLVILHCNFNNPFVDEVDTALNLTIAQAEKLLKHYSYIVIGHEHNTRWEMNHRLLALGNTHPTGFGDISNKYVWHFDKTQENPWSRTKIWDKDYLYVELNASDIFDLPESEFDVNEGVEPPQFVDIVGDLDAEHMPELAHRLGLIWNKWSPFMVRNQVNAVTEATESLMEEGYKIEDFSAKIKDGLVASPKLLAKFNDELAKVEE